MIDQSFSADTQVVAQVKSLIFDNLQWLPQESYNDNEVNERADRVYQHIYSTYLGYSYNTLGA